MKNSSPKRTQTIHKQLLPIPKYALAAEAKRLLWLRALAADLSDKMNVGLPIEHDLALTDDYKVLAESVKNCYSKSENGLVVVHLNIMRADESAFPSASRIPNLHIGTLPAGFLLSKDVYFSCNGATGIYSGYSPSSLMLFVQPSGKLMLQNPHNYIYKISRTVLYYAQ